LDIEESSDDSRCPACQCTIGEVVQRIDLASQHRHYSKDELLQKQLTTLAEVPNHMVEMVKCDFCGLEYAKPLRAPGAAWYSLVYEALDLYPAKRWEFEFVLKTVAIRETLGELGSGSGEFLRLCQQAGVSASGVDFSQQAVDSCVRAGLVAKRIDLKNETAAFPGGVRPDVIVAFQVLEHLESPRALFTCARHWASSHGRLWIAVPSNRRPSRFLRERDFLDEPPHHMTRWTESALVRIAEGTGWQCRRVIYEPIDWSTKLWWLSTHSNSYKRLQGAGLLTNRWLERLLRTVLAPSAWVQSIFHGSSISGQTMLAEYARTDEQMAS
jgi:SAM-dependent methyltransferase